MKNLTEKITQFETEYSDILIDWLKLVKIVENKQLNTIENRLQCANLVNYEAKINKDIILTYLKYNVSELKPYSFEYTEPSVDLVLFEKEKEEVYIVDDVNRFNTEYILSLPFEDGVKHILDIVDNSYKYYRGNSDDENIVVENFLAQECFTPYHNKILVMCKNGVIN